MAIKLVDQEGHTIDGPYIIRLQGWTVDRYYREAPSNQKCEFVRGELILFSPMTIDHGDMVSFLDSLLRMYCDHCRLGRVMAGTTVEFGSDIHREPDLFFVPSERSRQTSGMPLKDLPGFIIEVAATTREMDLREKAQDYESAGVEEYWVVDMEKYEVVVHHLVDGKYQVESLSEGRITSEMVEGFFVESHWLWQQLLPSSYDCLQEILTERKQG